MIMMKRKQWERRRREKEKIMKASQYEGCKDDVDGDKDDDEGRVEEVDTVEWKEDEGGEKKRTR